MQKMGFRPTPRTYKELLFGASLNPVLLFRLADHMPPPGAIAAAAASGAQPTHSLRPMQKAVDEDDLVQHARIFSQACVLMHTYTLRYRVTCDGV